MLIARAAALIGTLLCALSCMLWATVAAAHPMPESRVWVDTTPGGVRLSLELPLNRLEFAYGQPLADAPASVLARHGEDLARYVLRHVSAGSGGTGWKALQPRLEVVGSDGSAELHAVLDLQAPPGADFRAFTLQYDAVTHEVRTHRVQVFLRNDWAGGFAGQPPVLLGTLDTQHTSLPIALGEAHTGGSVWSLLKGGAVHIAEGTDHLLFLLLLVIVAPLAASAGHWSVVRPVKSAVRQIAVVVTAFTVGHSLTLALGSTGLVVLPSTPVEVAVAASIAFAAVHAFRPLFANGEVAMALGFGLIHGFAFSASLSGAGLSVSQHAQALLAFNLGIEAMQLAVLAVVMPPLLMLSRTAPAFYAVWRRCTAVLAGALAVAWIIERAGMGSFSATAWIDDRGYLLAVVPVLLWLAALVSQARSRWAGARS